MSDEKKPEREMYEEINTLIESLGKAFDMKGEDVAKAVEAGALLLKLSVDGDGEKYVEARLGEKIAFVYPGNMRADMKKKAARQPS